jgi:hypothetical protein
MPKLTRDHLAIERRNKIESMQRLRQQLGQTCSDREIERHVDARLETASKRLDRGEGERGN